MYDYIRGILTHVNTNVIVIECQGIGYHVAITERWAVECIRALHQDFLVYTHVIFRETEHLIYGFHSREERECFRILISFSGIGPKLGLAILNALPLKILCSVVRGEDIRALSSVSGIGKKTAEKLMVELKQKLPALLPLDSRLEIIRTDTDSPYIEEGIQALAALGYSKIAAERMITEAIKDLPEGSSLTDILPIALKKNFSGTNKD
ncbi:Holliday junction ATP-dependent DNA helicase RuvA,Holliday junction DNA helicase RuvA,Holliday junction DNA helicase RuvA,RuvA N terminal domain [Chlamydia serpentis]|uniref:Holliday junction branch migration complex subunit RuvA n=1 Tax=Chlamydia serpentis TaxID=1967782 RepID=A0A2R8FBC1_9CHLA|nr:Holliday junction branch migration protein RuvA [Chlamydia serpentis]SPN73740.1 Holliday junction ATP-dependent DNA helicase RuvA,Holliday junction DNA helicase RuvA,Holliday junction DNA helicase RuvA,RuvA N terminal domain [Chlamydia serpentis]